MSGTWMASVMGSGSEEVFYVPECGWAAQMLGYSHGVGPYFSLPEALRRVEAIIGECVWQPRRTQQRLRVEPHEPQTTASIRAAYFEGFADARKDSCSASTDDEVVAPHWESSVAKRRAEKRDPVPPAAVIALRNELRRLRYYWMKIPNAAESQTRVVMLVDVERAIDAARVEPQKEQFDDQHSQSRLDRSDRSADSTSAVFASDRDEAERNASGQGLRVSRVSSPNHRATRQ